MLKKDHFNDIHNWNSTWWIIKKLFIWNKKFSKLKFENLPIKIQNILTLPKIKLARHLYSSLLPFIVGQTDILSPSYGVNGSLKLSYLSLISWVGFTPGWLSPSLYIGVPGEFKGDRRLPRLLRWPPLPEARDRAGLRPPWPPLPWPREW